MKKGTSSAEDVEKIKILQRLLQPKPRATVSTTEAPKLDTPSKPSVVEILTKAAEKTDQSNREVCLRVSSGNNNVLEDDVEINLARAGVDVALLRMNVWWKRTTLTRYERVTGCSEKRYCGNGETILRRLDSRWSFDEVFPHSHSICGANLKEIKTGLMVHVMTVQMPRDHRSDIAIQWAQHLLMVKRAFPHLPILIIYKESTNMRRTRDEHDVKVITHAFGLRSGLGSATETTIVFTMDMNDLKVLNLGSEQNIFEVAVSEIPPLRLTPAAEESFFNEIKKVLLTPNRSGKSWAISEYRTLASACYTSLDKSTMHLRFGEPVKRNMSSADPGLGDWYRPQFTGPPTTLFSSYNRAPYCTQRGPSCPMPLPSDPQKPPQAPTEENVQRPRNQEELREFREWKARLMEKKEVIKEEKVKEVPEVKTELKAEPMLVKEEPKAAKPQEEKPKEEADQLDEGDDSNDEDTVEDLNAVKKTIKLGLICGGIVKNMEDHMADLGVTLWATRYNDIDRVCTFKYYQRLTGCCVASSTQATAVCAASKSSWKVREAFMHNHLMTGVNFIDRGTNLMFHFIVFHMTLDQVKVMELLTQLGKHILQVKRFYPGVAIVLVGWIDGFNMVNQQSHRLGVVEHLFNLKRHFERKEDVARHFLIWTMSHSPQALCVQVNDQLKLQMLYDVLPPDPVNALSGKDEEQILEDLGKGLATKAGNDDVKQFKTFKEYAEKAQPINPKARKPAVLRFGFLHPTKNKEDGKRSFVFLVNEGQWYRPRPFRRLPTNPNSRVSASEALELKKEEEKAQKLVGICSPMTNTENRDFRGMRNMEPGFRNSLGPNSGWNHPGPMNDNRNYPGPMDDYRGFPGPRGRIPGRMDYTGPINDSRNFPGPMNDNRNFPGPMNDNRNFPGPMNDNRNFPGQSGRFPRGDDFPGPMDDRRNFPFPGNFDHLTGPNLYRGPMQDTMNFPGSPGMFPGDFLGPHARIPIDGSAPGFFQSRDPIPFPTPVRREESPEPVPDPVFQKVWNEGVEPEVKRSDSPGLEFLPKSIVGDDPKNVDWKNLQDSLTALIESKKAEQEKSANCPELLPPPIPPFMDFGIDIETKAQSRGYSTTVGGLPASEVRPAPQEEQRSRNAREEVYWKEDERAEGDKNWRDEAWGQVANRYSESRSSEPKISAGEQFEWKSSRDLPRRGPAGEHFSNYGRQRTPTRGIEPSFRSTRGGATGENFRRDVLPAGEKFSDYEHQRKVPPPTRGIEASFPSPRGGATGENFRRDVLPAGEKFSDYEHQRKVPPPTRGIEPSFPSPRGGATGEKLRRELPPPTRGVQYEDHWENSRRDVLPAGEKFSDYEHQRNVSPSTRDIEPSFPSPRGGATGEKLRRELPPPTRGVQYEDHWDQSSPRGVPRGELSRGYQNEEEYRPLKMFPGPAREPFRRGQHTEHKNFAQPKNIHVVEPFRRGEPQHHSAQPIDDLAGQMLKRDVPPPFKDHKDSWKEPQCDASVQERLPAEGRGKMRGRDDKRGGDQRNWNRSAGEFGRGKRSFGENESFPDSSAGVLPQGRTEDFGPARKASFPDSSAGVRPHGRTEDFGPARKASRPGEDFSPARGGRGGMNRGRGGFRGRGNEGSRGRGFVRSDGGRGRGVPSQEPAENNWSRFKM